MKIFRGVTLAKAPPWYRPWGRTGVVAPVFLDSGMTAYDRVLRLVASCACRSRVCPSRRIAREMALPMTAFPGALAEQGVRMDAVAGRFLDPSPVCWIERTRARAAFRLVSCV